MAPQLASFKNWLRSKSYSDSTTRNYLADVNKYLSSFGNLTLEISNSVIFQESSLSSYLNQISDKTFAARSLASLSKYCQFALDQKIISSNPIKNLIDSRGVINHAPTKSITEILSDFKTNLINHHKTDNTVNNYLNDIKQFINYCQKFET